MKRLTIKYLPKHLGMKYCELHKKLREFEVIKKPMGRDEYLLTDIALFYDLGEIRTTTVRSGYKKEYNVYNVDKIATLLDYDMTLYQLYESMYPDDEQQDASADDDPNDGYWDGWEEKFIKHRFKSHRSR